MTETWPVVSLLPGHADRKFAVTHPCGHIFDEFGHGFLAIGADQFSQGGEQGGLGETVTVNAIMKRFGPGFAEISDRRLFLFVIAHWCAVKLKTHGCCESTL